MANQSWAQPSGQPPEWAVEDGADATSSHSDPAQPAAPQRHAIGDALAAIEHSLDEVGTAQWQDVPESELRELTRRVARVSARLSAHQMAAARCMEKAGTARRAGATSTGQMMAGDFGGDRRGAEDLVRTAGTLDEAGASATQEALAAGDISPEQAKIIGRTVNALPKHLTERERLEVETKLLDAAGRLSLTDLRRLGLTRTTAKRYTATFPMSHVDEAAALVVAVPVRPGGVHVGHPAVQRRAVARNRGAVRAADAQARHLQPGAAENGGGHLI